MSHFCISGTGFGYLIVFVLLSCWMIGSAKWHRFAKTELKNCHVIAKSEIAEKDLWSEIAGNFQIGFGNNEVW